MEASKRSWVCPDGKGLCTKAKKKKQEKRVESEKRRKGKKKVGFRRLGDFARLGLFVSLRVSIFLLPPPPSRSVSPPQMHPRIPLPLPLLPPFTDKGRRRLFWGRMLASDATNQRVFFPFHFDKRYPRVLFRRSVVSTSTHRILTKKPDERLARIREMNAGSSKVLRGLCLCTLVAADMILASVRAICSSSLRSDKERICITSHLVCFCNRLALR